MDFYFGEGEKDTQERRGRYWPNTGKGNWESVSKKVSREAQVRPFLGGDNEGGIAYHLGEIKHRKFVSVSKKMSPLSKAPYLATRADRKGRRQRDLTQKGNLLVQRSRGRSWDGGGPARQPQVEDKSFLEQQNSLDPGIGHASLRFRG